jgi:hypothetical protein
MSDTYRWIQPGWDYPGSKSKKHQAKDRPSSKIEHRFSSCVKNSKRNLLNKIDELRLKESMP